MILNPRKNLFSTAQTFYLHRRPVIFEAEDVNVELTRVRTLYCRLGSDKAVFTDRRRDIACRFLTQYSEESVKSMLREALITSHCSGLSSALILNLTHLTDHLEQHFSHGGTRVNKTHGVVFQAFLWDRESSKENGVIRKNHADLKQGT